mmetsp:Transcript_10084/g.23518  ORF Transcript_10084/g.23518 Transcript_10084/m.23518 type:complete len:279 (+) Transcript_10084:64-900(+)
MRSNSWSGRKQLQHSRPSLNSPLSTVPLLSPSSLRKTVRGSVGLPVSGSVHSADSTVLPRRKSVRFLSSSRCRASSSSRLLRAAARAARSARSRRSSSSRAAFTSCCCAARRHRYWICNALYLAMSSGGLLSARRPLKSCVMAVFIRYSSSFCSASQKNVYRPSRCVLWLSRCRRMCCKSMLTSSCSRPTVILCTAPSALPAKLVSNIGRCVWEPALRCFSLRLLGASIRYASFACPSPRVSMTRVLMFATAAALRGASFSPSFSFGALVCTGSLLMT